MCNSIDEKYKEFCSKTKSFFVCKCCEGRSGLPREKEIEVLEKFITPPNIVAKVINFGSALYHHALDGFLKTTPKEYKFRLDICNDCDRLQDGMCLECGCPVDAKASWRSEGCPLKKWEVITPSGGGCGACGS